MRAYQLPDARITLTPGSTAEIRQGGNGTRSIDLIQGEALIDLQPNDAAGKATQIVVGDARLAVEAGSTVLVLRRPDALDVSVQRGGADLVSPTVAEHLAAGRRRLEVPIRHAPPARVGAAPPATEGNRERRPVWYTRYLAGDLDGASALLPADIEPEVTSASSAQELVALADLMAHAGRKQGASLAWERVITRFESDPRAVIAAEKLADTHPGRALDLALRSGNDAMVCHVLLRERDRSRAARVARQYLSTHPASDCRDALAAIEAPPAP
jgi:hypothetical protein